MKSAMPVARPAAINAVVVVAKSEGSLAAGSLIIVEARYGWATNIWGPSSCSHANGCKDVTSIVQSHVTNDNCLHFNSGCQAQYMNRTLWPETAGGPAIPRKLAVKYRIGNGPVKMIESACVPNETADLLIEGGISSSPAASASSSVHNNFPRGIIASLGVRNVSVRFSSDCANFYSKSTGHITGDKAQSTAVLLENKHKGDAATQWSKGSPGAWFTVDLKQPFRVSSYVYRGDAGGGQNHPRSWDLQASNDDSNWVTLSSHKNDNTITMENSGCFQVSTGNSYSMYRIQNRGSPNHLCCSGIEFYEDKMQN